MTKVRKNLMFKLRIKNVRPSFVVASHGVHTYFPDFQSQAVVMEVLSVGGEVVGERGVREQIITTVPRFISYTAICNTSRT